MVTSIFRKCCICRNSVVSKTLQNVMDIILPKLLFHTEPCPRLFNDLIFNRRSIGVVSLHTDSQQSGMDTVLKKQSTSIFRKPPEEANSKVLWNTATQITCYRNIDHIVFIHHCETKNRPSNSHLISTNHYFIRLLTRNSMFSFSQSSKS
jgi:hypothetical protein